MKKLLIIFLLTANISYAFNSGLNVELSYIYITFVIVVLLIIGIDKGIKNIRKKRKEPNEIFNQRLPADPME